jgi:hypothetical protein
MKPTKLKASSIHRPTLVAMLGADARFASNDEDAPTSSRHCAEELQPEGASHATKHDHDIGLLKPGRRQGQENSLTQQATNSTCVTARRDGQLFAGIEAEENESARAIVRGEV